MISWHVLYFGTLFCASVTSTVRSPLIILIWTMLRLVSDWIRSFSLQTYMTYVSIESYTALAKEAETIIIMCCLFKSGDSLLRCSQGYASRRSRDCIGYRSDDLECDKYDNIRNQDYLYTSTGVRMNETKAEFSLRST
jgi:hypothetical protein